MNKCLPDFYKPIVNVEQILEELKCSLTIEDWHLASFYQTLSEPFIEKYKDKVDWIYISSYQKLSEPFIEKWKNKVGWYCISSYQELSESFIEKWKNKINFNYLSNNKKINWNDFSEEFFDKYNQHFDLEKINKIRSFSKAFCLKYNLDWRWNKQ